MVGGTVMLGEPYGTIAGIPAGASHLTTFSNIQ
jgi:hypothetical protein